MLEYKKSGAVALLTINRPERRNALGSELVRLLSAAISDAQSDAEIGSIVLAAAPPAFCAGSDLKELGTLSIEEMCKHEADTALFARALGFGPKPIVAAVEGYALGGGFILAASCDIVVSARDARWHLPEVPNGWLPPWGLVALLGRVGPVRARRLTWAAAPIDAAEAFRIGLVDEMAEPGAALGEAMKIASSLASLPREAVYSTKRFFDQFILGDAERLDELASREFARNCESSRAQETLARFAVKRR